MFLRSRSRPVLEADKLTAVSEPIVCTICNSRASHSPVDINGLLRGPFLLYFSYRESKPGLAPVAVPCDVLTPVYTRFDVAACR
jgi:hypothetical protein